MNKITHVTSYGFIAQDTQGKVVAHGRKVINGWLVTSKVSEPWVSRWPLAKPGQMTRYKHVSTKSKAVKLAEKIVQS